MMADARLSAGILVAALPIGPTGATPAASLSPEVPLQTL